MKCGESGEIPVILSLRARMTAGMTSRWDRGDRGKGREIPALVRLHSPQVAGMTRKDAGVTKRDDISGETRRD